MNIIDEMKYDLETWRKELMKVEKGEQAFAEISFRSKKQGYLNHDYNILFHKKNGYFVIRSENDLFTITIDENWRYGLESALYHSMNSKYGVDWPIILKG